MSDTTKTTIMHDNLWKLWDILPPGTKRDQSIINGYKGLMQQYDAGMARALLNTAHAQGKVSDEVYEAIVGAYNGEAS